MDELSDLDLLRAHVAGDQTAFATLFRRHADRLWRLALRRVGDAQTAQDILQEAMINAFRAAASFRGEAAVSTWLHSIVNRAALSYLRSPQARVRPALDPELLPEPVDPGRPTEEMAIAQVESAEIATALDRLPPDQRAAVVLMDLCELSAAEAAVILSCAEGTVRSRASRGRRALAPLLSHLVST